MFRSLFIAASLTALMFASGGAPVALAAEPQPALNIGFVLYSKGYEWETFPILAESAQVTAQGIIVPQGVDSSMVRWRQRSFLGKFRDFDARKLPPATGRNGSRAKVPPIIRGDGLHAARSYRMP
jgi:hypothetical protein